jgi:hypothetical protein
MASPWKCRFDNYWLPYYHTGPLPSNAYAPIEAAHPSFSDPALAGEFKGGWAMIQLCRYKESPVGLYNELIFIPGYFDVPGQNKKNLRITRIYVSQKDTLYHGNVHTLNEPHDPLTPSRPQKLEPPQGPRPLHIYGPHKPTASARAGLPPGRSGHDTLLHRHAPATPLGRSRLPLLHNPLALPRRRRHARATAPPRRPRRRRRRRHGLVGTLPAPHHVRQSTPRLGLRRPPRRRLRRRARRRKVVAPRQAVESRLVLGERHHRHARLRDVRLNLYFSWGSDFIGLRVLFINGVVESRIQSNRFHSAVSRSSRTRWLPLRGLRCPRTSLCLSKEPYIHQLLAHCSPLTDNRLRAIKKRLAIFRWRPAFARRDSAGSER